MKRIIALVLICCSMLSSSFVLTNASSQNVDVKSGFVVKFNNEKTDYSSVIYNNTHYLPMRKVFEMMDSVVFYRSRDSKALILTRDGDVISHVVGDNTITVNGKEKTFKNPSIVKNNETYISTDMISETLYPDRIYYHDQQLYIDKQLITNEYHKVIKDVLDVAHNDNFYPERFKKYKNYHGKHPEYSVEDAIFRVNLGLDTPFYENITTIENPYELSVLVNKYNKLPEKFSQRNLVEMNAKYTIRDGKEYLLAGVAYEKYKEMWNDAKKEGLSLMVVSAYRTEDYQRRLYNNKVRSSGKAHADAYSARAGHSEHQTGLAVDICSTNTSFERSAEFKWMQKHGHEYGFIMRYPKGKEWITGYAYEPWHYRYVGVDVATKIHNEGITYEEYYAKYKFSNEFN